MKSLNLGERCKANTSAGVVPRKGALDYVVNSAVTPSHCQEMRSE